MCINYIAHCWDASTRTDFVFGQQRQELRSDLVGTLKIGCWSSLSSLRPGSLNWFLQCACARERTYIYTGCIMSATSHMRADV